MKKTEKIVDAIGNVSSVYVDEYSSDIEGSSNIKAKSNNHKRNFLRGAVAVATAAAAAFALWVGLPLLRGSDETDDKVTPRSEVIVDALGREITHVINGFAGGAEFIPGGGGAAGGARLDWYSTAYWFMTQESDDILAIKGSVIKSDSYMYESEYEDGTPKTVCATVSEIKITEVLKENNTSGYNVGDVVRIIESYAFSYDEHGNIIYQWDDDMYDGDVVTLEGEAVYFISRNDERSYISDDVKSTGLVTGDVWELSGAFITEEFNALWREVTDNWDYYESNY